MGQWVWIFILTALALALLRLVAAPIRLAWKLIINGLIGVASLYLVNLASGITGVYIPINAVTAVLAGALGLPGIGLLALIEIWT